MKRISNLTILLFVFIALSSFSTSYYSEIRLTKKVVTIEFTFSTGGNNGCSYHVVATINTDLGNGFGTITQTCYGQTPRRIGFKITSATVSLSLRGQITVTPDDLSDFIDEANETTVQMTLNEKTGISDGINFNGEFVD